ncbi:hypothetical protein V8C37DRAFT_397066 [Trichoderma ceciliae]
MAPKARTKPNTRARMQRMPTKFSELDVTPSRPGDKHHSPLLNETGKLPLSQTNADDCPPGGDEAGKSVSDGHQQDVTTADGFAWSEAGSTNITRRSTPVNPDDILAEECWDFDDEDASLAPFSSPSSAKNKLPDTMPLVRENQADEWSHTPRPQIDFSETASTIRRSSPFAIKDASKDLWDFSESFSSRGSSPDTLNNKGQTLTLSATAPSSEPLHLPMEDLYDATPRKLAAPVEIITEQKGNKPRAIGEIQGHSTDTILQQKPEPTTTSSQACAKSKKRRQRAKEPIRFDPLTQEIIHVPISKKRTTPARLPIVSALQESARGSSSPFASSQNRPEGRSSKQRQQRPKRGRAAKRSKPEAETAQRNPPDFLVLNSNPSNVVVDSPSVCPKDLPSVEHEETMENLPIGTSDVSDANKASKHHRHPSLATNEMDNASESLPTEHRQFKRRRLSRQFSISEKGSPVVTRDAAPINKADPEISELDPFLTGNATQTTAAPLPSFSGTTSSDRRNDQQLDSAFGDIDGKSSSRWLRRMDEQKPQQKRKSSMGPNLHEKIMKSFLGVAEAVQGPEDDGPTSSAEMSSCSRASRQIRLIADVSSTQCRQFGAAEMLTT